MDPPFTVASGFGSLFVHSYSVPEFVPKYSLSTRPSPGWAGWTLRYRVVCTPDTNILVGDTKGGHTLIIKPVIRVITDSERG